MWEIKYLPLLSGKNNNSVPQAHPSIHLKNYLFLRPSPIPRVLRRGVRTPRRIKYLHQAIRPIEQRTLTKSHQRPDVTMLRLRTLLALQRTPITSILRRLRLIKRHIWRANLPSKILSQRRNMWHKNNLLKYSSKNQLKIRQL